MTSAARERRRRERRREGHSCYTIELSDSDLEIFLEVGGYLTIGAEHTKEAVALALKAFLEDQVSE